MLAAARMLDLYPSTQIRLTTMNWADVPRLVREREAVIGIADISDLGDAPDLQVEPLQPMPGVFLVRPGHPLAAPGAPLDLPRIMASPLIFLGRVPRRVQEPLVLAREQARQAGRLHPAFPALMLESPTAAITAAQESNAVAGTTIALAEAAIAAGLVVPLPWRAPWMEVRLGILRLRRHQPSEAEAAFLDLLRTADAEANLRAHRFLAAHGFDPVP
ncbi:substrate-binding domain-containing protein [Dankookia sp. P2]|uniref:substrate-binding domain-containing protein n=1 Tax=Dankookia sp. P2 TaxID=3423955 RepID=UPI003D672514